MDLTRQRRDGAVRIRNGGAAACRQCRQPGSGSTSDQCQPNAFDQRHCHDCDLSGRAIKLGRRHVAVTLPVTRACLVVAAPGYDAGSLFLREQQWSFRCQAARKGYGFSNNSTLYFGPPDLSRVLFATHPGDYPIAIQTRCCQTARRTPARAGAGERRSVARPTCPNKATARSICSRVCAALTLERSSARPLGVAGGRLTLV